MLSVILPIMFAATIPFALTLATKARVFSGRDNRQTRVWQGQLTGWRQRAYWAHQNAFETFPLFASGVILAHLAAPGGAAAAALAWAYPVTRVGYSLCYVFDKAPLRSLVWFMGMGCIVGLFVVALAG